MKPIFATLIFFSLAGVCHAQKSESQPSAERIARYEQDKATKEAQLARNVAEYKAAKGASRETIKVRIELTLHEIFDLNMHIREEQVRQLELELKEVRKSNEYRKNNKSRIVNQKMTDLLGS